MPIIKKYNEIYIENERIDYCGNSLFYEERYRHEVDIEFKLPLTKDNIQFLIKSRNAECIKIGIANRIVNKYVFIDKNCQLMIFRITNEDIKLNFKGVGSPIDFEGAWDNKYCPRF